MCSLHAGPACYTLLFTVYIFFLKNEASFFFRKKLGNTPAHTGSGMIHKNIHGVHNLLRKYENSFKNVQNQFNLITL